MAAGASAHGTSFILLKGLQSVNGFEYNFLNNVLTSAIKTHAHIPCRWHKLSRCSFLFGFVSKKFQLNVKSVSKSAKG